MINRNYRRPVSNRGGGFAVIVAIFIVLVIVGVIVFNIVSLNHRVTQSCTVNDKDRAITVHNGDSQTDYRLYTSCGVLRVHDEFWLGKFNSADTYASIEAKHTYEFTTVGFRNGWFSWFPNVVEAKEVK